MKTSQVIIALTQIMAKYGDPDVITPGLDESGHDDVLPPHIVRHRQWRDGEFRLGDPMVMIDWTPIHGSDYIEDEGGTCPSTTS